MLVAIQERRNRIGKLLDQKGITRYRLADLVGMSRTAIYNLVDADNIPEGTSYGTLRKIADVLGVGVDDLEDRDDLQE